MSNPILSYLINKLQDIQTIRSLGDIYSKDKSEIFFFTLIPVT